MESKEALMKAVAEVVETLEELDKHGSCGEYDSILSYVHNGTCGVDRHYVSSDGQYMGSSVSESLFGPTITIETDRSVVTGSHGGDRVYLEYDSTAFNDYIADLYEML